MPSRVLASRHSHRDLMLDWASVLLAAALLALAATALNRLPYPGSQPYAGRISAVLTAPLLPAVPDAVPAAEPAAVTTEDIE